MGRPEDHEHGWLHGKVVRLRWDTFDQDLKDFCTDKGFGPTTRAKVVMISRLGDVGLTTNLSAEHGYALRLEPHQVVTEDGEPGDCCEFHWHGADRELVCRECPGCDRMPFCMPKLRPPEGSKGGA